MQSLMRSSATQEFAMLDSRYVFTSRGGGGAAPWKGLLLLYFHNKMVFLFILIFRFFMPCLPDIF